MIAVPLLFGRLTAQDYEDNIANDPRIDTLREKMLVSENPQFTKEYFDPDKRYIGNAIEVFFKDGSRAERVAIDYPIGHRKRRDEGIPMLIDKFCAAVNEVFDAKQAAEIEKACEKQSDLEEMKVADVQELWAKT